jgi:predicted pyridoxine 5'-phosphate oxidase superfamily flavin-nucleotide-binding protein
MIPIGGAGKPQMAGSRERSLRAPVQSSIVEGGGAVSQDYHEGQRGFQDQFDTRRLADRLAESTRDFINPDHKAFIEGRDMFFIATASGDGWPECSYKGGGPGFVRVVDEHTIAFPLYEGNGMYLSSGNLAMNSKVGLLFVSLENGTRLRVSGEARVSSDDPLIDTYPGAQLVVRVRVREVFPNCRRYVHRYQLVERSPFVPDAQGDAPVPDWKREPHFEGSLPANDRALDPDRPSAPSIPEF